MRLKNSEIQILSNNQRESYQRRVVARVVDAGATAMGGSDSNSGTTTTQAPKANEFKFGTKKPDFLPSPPIDLVERCISDLLTHKSMPEPAVKPEMVSEQLGFVTKRQVQPGEALLSLPTDAVITRKNVDDDPDLAQICEGLDSISALGVWLMKQRAMQEESEWSSYLRSLPLFTYSPLTWTAEERNQYLKGTMVLSEANSRVSALESMWTAINKRITALNAFPELRSSMDIQAFFDAFSTVLAYHVRLSNPQAGEGEGGDIIALIPSTEHIKRNYQPQGVSGSGGVCNLEYDSQTNSVVLRSNNAIPAGEEVFIAEALVSNAELLLSRGELRSENPEDFVVINANVVMADALYGAKKQVLEAYGMSSDETFLVYKDRLPLTLLSYLRLSRLQSTNDMLKLNFEADQIVSEMNEYEVLQLLLSEARMISGGYTNPDVDSDLYILKDQEAQVPARLGAMLRIGEKKVLSSFMDAVRTRLAPIRGIPTKKGMENQNQEIIDMFDAFEAIPKAPGKLVNDLKNWWTDEENWKIPDEKNDYNS